MPVITIRDAEQEDYQAVVDLNAAFVSFLSPMDMNRLQDLAKQLCYFKVADKEGKIVGFLMAFPSAAIYDNSNFRWFARRFQKFVYIDRIIVGDEVRGEGVGASFYRDLEGCARETNAYWLTAEVDIEPPNRSSLVLHERLGFVEVGQRQLDSSDKVVSLQARSLSSNADPDQG